MDNKGKFFTLTLICAMLLYATPVLATASTENGSGNSTTQNNTVTTTTVTNHVAGNSANQTNNVYKPTVNVTLNITPVTHHNAPVFAHTVADNGVGKSTNENVMVVPPTVNFTANVTSGRAPLSVLFISNGTGFPTAFNWTFGDGIYSNNNWTAIHTYARPGKYDMSATISNAAGNNTSTKLGYINVSKAVVVNNRILCSGKAPWKVSFKDNSRKHIASFWNLGDGTTTRNKNILHIYKNPGKYPITLKYVTVGHVKHTLRAGYILVK
jgi:PKD repeat protein